MKLIRKFENKKETNLLLASVNAIKVKIVS